MDNYSEISDAWYDIQSELAAHNEHEANVNDEIAEGRGMIIRQDELHTTYEHTEEAFGHTLFLDGYVSDEDGEGVITVTITRHGDAIPQSTDRFTGHHALAEARSFFTVSIEYLDPNLPSLEERFAQYAEEDAIERAES